MALVAVREVGGKKASRVELFFPIFFLGGGRGWRCGVEGGVGGGHNGADRLTPPGEGGLQGFRAGGLAGGEVIFLTMIGGDMVELKGTVLVPLD